MRRWTVAQRPATADPAAAEATATVTEEVAAEVATLLESGGVLLLPTDTIYGLHAVATDARAVDRITSMKGRDDTKPFVVIAADLGQIEALGVELATRTRAVLEALWPAPLTAVLRLHAPIPASRGMATLAVRIPALPWLRQVMIRTGPLASTSANRSGEPVITAPDDLSESMRDALDGLVEAGPISGKPSAIVDFTGTEPQFIREGNRAFTQQVRKTLRKSL